MPYESLLNFQSIKGKKTFKETQKKLYNQDAYDCWHTYDFLKQIYFFKKKKLSQLSIKEKNLIKNKYLILVLLSKLIKPKSFLELGSSVFETIDGLEKVKDVFKNFGFDKINFNKIRYFGIEISSYLRYVSKLIHKDYIIKTFSKLPSKKIDLVYDRLVSSYAFNDEKMLSKMINNSKVSFCNLSLFRNLKDNSFNGNGFAYGKRYKLFNIKQLSLKKNIQGYYLFGKQNPNHKSILYSKKTSFLRMDGFFVFCDKIFFEKFKRCVLEFNKKNKNFLNNLNTKKFINIQKLKNSHFYLVKN